jgi:PAS domain S-box-containing protein
VSQRATGPAASLIASERKFQAVTESIGDAVIVTDTQSEILFWNAGAEDVFGYSEEEAIGSPLTMLMPERFRAPHRAGLARVLAGGEPHVIGSTVRLAGLHREGHEFPIELTLGRWTDDERDLFTGVIHDISDRERADRYLAAQLAVTALLVEATRAEEAVPRLLPTLAEKMGWQIATLWTFDDSEEYLRCEQLWRADEVVADAFEARTRELTFRRGEGFPGRVWDTGEAVCVVDFSTDDAFPRAPLAAMSGLHRAIGIPLVVQGEVRGVIEFLTYEGGEPDVGLTDMMQTLGRQLGLFFLRRRTERELEQTRADLERRAEELERSNADLEQFAYVASHDLSEPLRMVGGFVQLLAKRYRGKLDDDADEFITHTLSGVDRMRRLIDDLLLFSRAGSVQLVARHVSLDEVIERVRHNLGAALADSGGVVRATGLPEVVGDVTQLEQLFQNLISNALKFRGEAAPTVDVLAERGRGEWRITIQDNGIGIEPRHAERVFKMFQRLHGRDAYTGTGIGLAICKRIVERHGGEISVGSNPDGGSRFSFTLPDREAGVTDP